MSDYDSLTWYGVQKFTASAFGLICFIQVSALNKELFNLLCPQHL